MTERKSKPAAGGVGAQPAAARRMASNVGGGLPEHCRHRQLVCGRQGMNVSELRAASIAFFNSCLNVRDHLRADPAVPESVGDQAASHVKLTQAFSWPMILPIPISTGAGR